MTAGLSVYCHVGIPATGVMVALSGARLPAAVSEAVSVCASRIAGGSSFAAAASAASTLGARFDWKELASARLEKNMKNDMFSA